MVVKKIYKIVNYCSTKLVTVFGYDENNKLILTAYWEFFADDIDEYVDSMKELYHEDGVEMIIERLDKIPKN